MTEEMKISYLDIATGLRTKGLNKEANTIEELVASQERSEVYSEFLRVTLYEGFQLLSQKQPREKIITELQAVAKKAMIKFPQLFVPSADSPPTIP